MIYVLLAEGFEETEALAPVDLMRRAGLAVTTVAVGDGIAVRGSHGIQVNADLMISEIPENAPIELLMLPGGMPGTTNLDASGDVHRLIDSAIGQGARLAAICAAPMILGKRGDLKGLRAVCYPGFEKYLDGAVPCGGRVVTDRLVTTGAGAGAAIEFALELIAQLRGSDTAENIKNAIIG